ncbi:MAG: hypothetical protein JO115_22485 [Pseudonocardiales bacterium]|nr:hypothetical protein [Pseudonocardiales bacterium]
MTISLSHPLTELAGLLGKVPIDPEDQERVAPVAYHPRRVDDATVSALADVLTTTRRLEDQVGSAAVLPGIRSTCALARDLLADARGPIRGRVGSLAGELHQYLGRLLAKGSSRCLALPAVPSGCPCGHA